MEQEGIEPSRPGPKAKRARQRPAPSAEADRTSGVCQLRYPIRFAVLSSAVPDPTPGIAFSGRRPFIGAAAFFVLGLDVAQ